MFKPHCQVFNVLWRHFMENIDKEKLNAVDCFFFFLQYRDLESGNGTASGKRQIRVDPSLKKKKST